MKLTHIFFAVLFFISASTLAAADTTYVFAKQLNHFYSFGGHNYLRMESGPFTLRSKIDNSSSIYSETSRLKSLSTFDMEALYKLGDKFSAGLSGNIYTLRDGQTYHAYDYDRTQAGILGKFVHNNVLVSLENGYSSENRLGIYDPGFYTEFSFDRLGKDQLLDPFLDWEYSRHKGRANYTFNNKISSHFISDKGMENHLSTGFKVYYRNYYINREGDTEQRLNTNTYFHNRLVYPLKNGFALKYKLQFDLNQDGLDFNYNNDLASRVRERLLLKNDIRLHGRCGQVYGYAGFTNQYEQSDTRSDNPDIILPADYYFDKKNVISRISWHLSDKDSLSVDYLGSLLYYDTPDTNNYDDRDELTYSITPRWDHRINSHTRASVSFNTFLHHYAYLFHQKSAQNHWNRIFTLKSALYLNLPGQLNWRSEQHIFSNYFVYDYEDSSFVHVQSMVFRGFKIQENITYYINSSVFLKCYAYFRWEDNGILDWTNWIQELTDSKYILKLELMPGYQIKRFKIAAGPVISRRKDYRYDMMIYDDENYHSYRLGGAVQASLGNSFYLSYRLERIDQTGRAIVYNQSGNLRWTFVF